MSVQTLPWGVLKDAQPVMLAALRNASGFEVRVSNFGAMIVGIRTRDARGQLGEVVLGFDSFEDYRSPAYLAARPCFGATIGRFANRIGGARFALDGQEHVLEANEGANQLHGGACGFDQAIWAMETLADEVGVRFSLVSPHGDQGFPGTLNVTVDMVVAQDEDTLTIRYRATTDRPTHLNLTSHPYFNLDRDAVETVRGHWLQVFADQFTPADAQFIPNGGLVDVAGGPLDLRAPKMLGTVIDHPLLAEARGLNHNYVLTGRPVGALRPAARLSEPRTRRAVEIWTTEPGLQVYSAGLLARLAGRRGERFGPESGVCLETQHFPDSPNQPGFPTTRLDPGQIFRSETQLRFSAEP